MKHLPYIWSGLLIASPSALHAGCCEHHDPSETYRRADAIGEYRIVGKECVAIENGRIVTRFTASLNAALKGNGPAELKFETPGGQLRHKVEVSSLQLDLAEGDDSIIHLRQNADGTWTPIPFRTLKNAGSAAVRKGLRDFIRHGARGRSPQAAPAPDSFMEYSGIPSSTVTPTGYMENAAGHPARATLCDGGREIPYLVDIDVNKLPPGMDQAGALAAVEEALGVWEAASSLRFRFEGLQSFGMAASDISAVDRRLRIQLHDTYDELLSPAVGVAGGQPTTSPAATTVFCGGKISSQGFQEMLSSYVVLEHDADFMDTVANFKHVLTHELGHSLGLGHSSNDPAEPSAILKDATMYYQASNDGRGTALTDYDKDRAAFGYPLANTPPYTPDRIIRAVCRTSSSSPLPAVPGVNRINLRAIDRDGGTLSPAMAYSTGTPTKFSFSGSLLTFAPSDFVTQSRLSDAVIESGLHAYPYAYVQFSDGVNLSRAARCTVIEIASDSTPADGLPNSWMTTNFGGTAVGAVGANNHPDSDPDGDGLTNREEFFQNTNPNLDSSGPVRPAYDHAARKLEFTPLRFASYAVESATSPAGPWTLHQLVTNFSAAGPIQTEFTGAAPPREFYRVVTGP